MYASYADYITYFGEGITQTEYDRYAFEADRALDTATTGIDNVHKLRVAFPHEDAEAVIFCACKIANYLKQIADIQASAGYADTENGKTGIIASMSSGNESISYTSGDTAVNKAASDVAEKKRLIADTIKETLSGVQDANGVNLLYMGVYPCTVTL